MGRARDVGVPGMDPDGAGEAGAIGVPSGTPVGLEFRSGGAGLLVDTRRPGRSIFVTLLCCLSVNSPSLVLRLYMWTERSDDCVATYSFKGSHATP